MSLGEIVMSILEVDELILENVAHYAKSIDPRYKSIYKYRDIAVAALDILQNPGPTAIAGRLIPNHVHVETWRDQLQGITFYYSSYTSNRKIYYAIDAKDVPKLFTSVDELVWHVKWVWFWMHLSLTIDKIYGVVERQRHTAWISFWGDLAGVLEGRICSSEQL
jgi:hypothetical protein